MSTTVAVVGTNKKNEMIAKIEEALSMEGFRHAIQDGSVVVAVGTEERPLNAVISYDEEQDDLDITCQVATLGDFGEKAGDFALHALADNIALRPYAFALVVSDEDSQSSDFDQCPLILTDSVPCCNLSVEEIEEALSCLLRAIEQADPIIAEYQS